MSIEQNVGRGTFESWPTGATRAITTLEVQLKEVCDICLSNNKSVINDLITRFKLLDEQLDLPENREIKKFWKDVKDAVTAIDNTIKRIKP